MQAERGAALRMIAMVVAGFQPSGTLWWSTVHSAAQSVSSREPIRAYLLPYVAHVRTRKHMYII